MSQWYALALLCSYAVFWGLRKGSMLCVTVCAPGLVPYVADREMDWREGMKVGVLFNLPRLILFAAIGAAIGLASFALIENEVFVSATERAGVAGYILVGVILFIYGLYMFMTALEEEQDRAEGKVLECRAGRGEGEEILDGGTGEKKRARGGPLPHSRLARWTAGRLGEEGSPFLLIWGSVLGLACIGETVLALESAMLGGVVASFASTPLRAATLGMIVMLSFGIGAAVPVVVVTSASGKLSTYIKARERVLKLKIVSSLFMILVGLALLLLFGARALVGG